LLREEWRDGFLGRKIDRARMLVRHAQDLTGDSGVSISLARIDLQLERYAGTPSDERKELLSDIGRDLSAVRDRLPSLPVRPDATPTLTRAPKRPSPPAAPRQVSLDAPITTLPNVGEKKAKPLEKLG